MMYVFGMMYALLVGFVSGWFMYNACAGSKRDHLSAVILWGIGMTIISILATATAHSC